MKKLILLLSLLVMVTFLVGCAEKELTAEGEQTLEAELEQLSDEELDQVIEQGESEEDRALTGQAYNRINMGQTSFNPSTALKAAYKVKLQRSLIPELECTTDSDCSGVQICHKNNCEFGMGCCLHMGEDDHCEEMNGWECDTGWFISVSCDDSAASHLCS